MPNGPMKRFVKGHWTRIVDQQMYMLRESENLEGKVWNIAPIVKRREAFITIDRAVVWGILTDARLNNDKRVPINPTSEKPYGSTITTVTSPEAAGQTVVDSPRRVIVIDPGRTNLICGGKTSPVWRVRLSFTNVLEASITRRVISKGITSRSSIGTNGQMIAHYCKQRCRRVRLDSYIGKKLLSTNSSIAYGRKWNRKSLSSPTATLRLHQQVEERGLFLGNGSKGSVRNDIKQSTSTNSVPQIAVGGAEVSCQIHNVDKFLKELNVQYVFQVSNGVIPPPSLLQQILICLS
eukprot:49571-Hanusia_phi.AAC.3